jgi:putative membrane protein (TIGR04086 family)
MEQRVVNGSKSGSAVLALIKVLLGMYLFTALFLLVLAYALYRFDLEERVVTIGILLGYVLACLIGGFRIGRRMKQKKYIWGFAAGFLYFAVLLAVSYFYHHTVGDEIAHLATTFAMCVASSTVGGMIS